MKKLIYLFIFGFIFYTQIEAQTIIMSNTTTNACGGTIVNPGGFGSYPAGANVVTTICPSVPGQCVRLNFTAFNLDLFGDDQLVIYDGPNTASPIIGTFTSNGNPGSIQSSTQSANGCITLRFTSSAFPFISGTGFQTNISCVTCEDPPPPPPTSCGNAAPFCTNIQGGITFPASTNINSEPGADYDCLFTQPNPAWYFLEISNPGPLTIFMQSTPLVDIDFIVWGPFNSLDNVCVGQLTAANVVDCSYSAASTETATIPNALTGQYYLFLITNFSNQPTNINFSQTGGTGSTNCQVLSDFIAVNQIPAQLVKLYPNPVLESFVIETELVNLPATIEIRDLQGQLVLSEIIQNEKSNFRFDNQSKGMFIYTIQNKKGLMQTGKFIRE